MKARTQGELAEKRFGPVSVPQLSAAQASWLAALVDGEGTIGIYRMGRTDGGSKYKYVGLLEISNTCKPLLEQAAVFVGDKSFISNHNPGNVRKKGHKPLYKLLLKCRTTPLVLKQILPWLIVKREQAKLVIEYYDAVHNAPLNSSSKHEVFEMFYNKSRALNKRGTG